MQSDLLQNRKPVLGTPRTYLACLPKSKRSPGSLRNRSVTWRSMATRFSDEPLCRAASRSSNREPSPRGMAVTHKLKTDAGAGLRMQRERPAAAHSGNNKMALIRRLADNRNELIPIAITHQKRNFFVNGLVSGVGHTGSVLRCTLAFRWSARRIRCD